MYVALSFFNTFLALGVGLLTLWQPAPLFGIGVPRALRAVWNGHDSEDMRDPL
jgi:hypothetical protein